MYQGVRVKITVKELLQQRRARQAAAGTAVSKTLRCLLCLFSLNPFAKTAVSGPRRLPKSECSGLVRMGEKHILNQGSCSSDLNG